MARMLPVMQLRNTGSKAEEQVFALLRDGLSDDFTAIHSLPWLCAAVGRICRDYAPTGEVVHAGMDVAAGPSWTHISRYTGGETEVCSIENWA